MAHLLAMGLGYSVAPLARRLLADGWKVSGTTRSADKADRLRHDGINPVLWTAGEPLPADLLSSADVVVVSVSPGEDGCPVAAAIDGVLSETCLLYLSSSGVYGDHDGAWIDETVECRPTSARGRHRLLAEDQWRDIAARSGRGCISAGSPESTDPAVTRSRRCAAAPGVARRGSASG